MERLKKFKSFKINEDIFGTFSFYNVKNHVNNIIKMMGDNEGGITYRKYLIIFINKTDHYLVK